MLLLPINYLARLDYVDIINLSLVNKQYSILGHNKTLKDIIALRGNLILPTNINIAKLLKELDDEISKLINYHYDNLPRWVNRELFMIDFKKYIRDIFIICLSQTLEGCHIFETKIFHKDLFNDDGTVTINLHKQYFTLPLTSSEYRGYNYDDEVPIDNIQLTISKQLINFINYVIDHNLPTNFNYHNLYRLLSDLLLFNS